jgi:hypothetical protein
MEYRQLGLTGLKVSLIGLGTMTFGEQNTEAEAHAQIDRALDCGVNLFDTSEMIDSTAGTSSRPSMAASGDCTPTTSTSIRCTGPVVPPTSSAVWATSIPTNRTSIRSKTRWRSWAISPEQARCATTMAQLETNLASIDVRLSDEVMQAIEAVHLAHPNPCP